MVIDMGKLTLYVNSITPWTIVLNSIKKDNSWMPAFCTFDFLTVAALWLVVWGSCHHDVKIRRQNNISSLCFYWEFVLESNEKLLIPYRESIEHSTFSAPLAWLARNHHHKARAPYWSGGDSWWMSNRRDGDHLCAKWPRLETFVCCQPTVTKTMGSLQII